jgi:diguanylate cyclase (GGDEF)-like protein/PAS domain S-box-containing protein
LPIEKQARKPGLISAGEPNRPRVAGGLPLSVLADRLRKQFRDLLELTRLVCESPEGAIHLLDQDRRGYTAITEEKTVALPLDACFCSYLHGQMSLVVVPDLREDPRFCGDILVTREPGPRFYAGYPLITDHDERIGSLCIRESAPRQLTPLQERALGVVARQVVAQIEAMSQLMALEAALPQKDNKLRELAASDARFRAFLDSSPVSAFIKDEDGRMIYCNRALAERFGATPEEWIGKTDFETWPLEIAEEFRSSDRQALEANQEIHFEDRTRGLDGRMVSWDVHKYPFVDADGRRSVACMALDVTRAWEAQQEVQRIQQELQMANERLQMLSLTDALTGLMNRRALEDCLENECARSSRSAAPLSLFMLDIDDFKGFNDTFGHVCGDEVLRLVAVLMQRWTRRGDLVARYGGEEFLVILPATDEKPAFAIAERLRQAIADAEWKHRRVTVSVGVATWNEHMPTATEFLHEVDQALYAAKRAGKNRVCQAPSDEPGRHE